MTGKIANLAKVVSVVAAAASSMTNKLESANALLSAKANNHEGAGNRPFIFSYLARHLFARCFAFAAFVYAGLKAFIFEFFAG